ncbi:deoxyribonuclease IV [Lacticaseibacillus zeae]|uniref:Probable endonuclease 4 n=1 Tax=Lacticaseibacillus zeae TaxID=57037 RepID=A0A5R8LZ91_LACZE|nr:deoxyribonuclease IV [Lacticaseibacillus zeae]OLS09799.1 endonuclease IV [Lacticaseibacillus casei]QVI33376.1 deoxyribonuclease IV [Lacticaseibacillus zeae]TLF41271.1 deoxyribonuclease IV [Lacticaseibacillus zeae]TLF42722.1 deoxyribonuclease IV [Lacticaseibacillus zeae]
MLIGANVSMKGTKMLLGAVEEAASYDANTLQFYTGAPQNTRRKPTSEMRIPEGLAAMTKHGISHTVIHAPYIVNLGNTKKPENFEFAVQFMREEVARADALHAYTMPFHPGAHVGAGPEAAIKQIVKGLNLIIDPKQHVTIALETMAGKGTEIGRSFEELAAIIDGVTYNEKLRVTFDTCHTNDAGYDVKDDFDGVLNEFDHVIGVDRLSVIHVNDSKNPRGSHKDRHANIGFGTIGFDALNRIAHHPALEKLPKILETPYVGPDKKHQVPPYGEEIKWLKSGHFQPEALRRLMD